MLYSIAREEYLAHIKLVRNYSDATIASYRGDLGLFGMFLSKQGCSDLIGIDQTLTIQFFTEQQTLNPKKPATIRRRVYSLSSFFKYCCFRKYMPFNPAEGIQLPKKERKIPQVLTETEFGKFISVPILYRKHPWLAKRDKAVIGVLAFTGCRRSELLGIRLKDINLESRNLLIVKGKGNKQRIIPICSRLASSLNEYLEVRPRANTDYLFLASNGLSKLGLNGLYKLFNRHLQRCGIQKQEITIHSMRHTFGTRVLRSSKDLVSVQNLLGHSSIDTTSIYLHVTDDDIRKAVDGTFIT
jgi:site-specific recombinase XerD